jgi:hypothetical protein
LERTILKVLKDRQKPGANPPENSRKKGRTMKPFNGTRSVPTTLVSLLLAWSVLLPRAFEPGAVAAAEERGVTIPTAADLASRLRKEHPRLLISANEFAELKQRVTTNAQLKEWHGKLREQARGILAQPPPRADIPDSWREIDSRVYTLALLYWLDGDRRYVERAWLEMQAVANRPDWDPHHFLHTAHMTQGLAIGYDWLYDEWTPAQRETLRRAMLEKGIQFANDVHTKDFTRWPEAARRSLASIGWSEANFNWNQVCNAGIGMGALALLDEAPQACGQFIQAAIRSIQRPMAEFAPDGAWEEGPGYWNYATSHNVLFLSALESALGTDFGLSQAPGFAETGLFPLYFTGPLGRTFNFADGLDTRYPVPQLFWLARKFNRPVYATHARHAALPKALDLLWFDPHSESPPASSLPLDKHFCRKEIAFFRSAWDDRDAVFIGFKAGDNKATHGHLDLGSFVLDALGARWAVDLGGENYSLPGYWDIAKGRWSYYRLRAEGHNTLVINPGAEADQDPKASTRIVRFQSEPEKAFAIADLTPAYAGQASQVQRGMALLDRRLVLLQDEVQTEKAADVWWFLHTPAQGEVSDDGATATLTQGNVRLMASVLSPPGARFRWMGAEALPTSPNPNGQKKNDGVRKLAVHLSGVTNVRLAVLLTPLRAGETAPKPMPEVIPLARW